VAEQTRPGRYETQAETYDRTRGASPTIVGLLLKHLAPGEGRSLLDVAGGTGNYAEVMRSQGFSMTVLDASREMLVRSVPKIGLGHQVVGDASTLPFVDAAFDAGMCVIAVHLFADRTAAFREARRVVREGPFIVVAYTRENLSALFVEEYFGGAWPGGAEFSAGEMAGEIRDGGFTTVEVETFVYRDAVGGSLVAMHTDAALLADPDRLRNTSFFYRLDGDVRRAGMEQLAADLRSGRLADRVRTSLQRAAETGHGTVFVARP
jgi:SAM-dependent methyltransferase